MRLFTLLFTIIIYIACSSSCQNSNDKKYSKTNSDTSQPPELEIYIKTDDIITLPELDGIKVYLKNNSARTIKIWENVNPLGLQDVSFLFETETNKKQFIEPVILNWKSDFSKVIEIKANEKFKLNPQLAHWTINSSQIEKTDTVIIGKIKAYYTVKQGFVNDEGVWTGEIYSTESHVKLKHNKIAKQK